MGINLKKWLSDGDDDNKETTVGNDFYTLKNEDSFKDGEGSNKMILLEPRAYSEAAQIVDFLRKRNTVVVNLKRVTGDQAKRIIDFLNGANYAINGTVEKIGGGIFLFTPNNVNVEGRITDDIEGKDIHDNNDINLEW